VAIVDRDMPSMDGIELAKAIKARPDIRETVLMILVSLEANMDPLQLRELGFAGQMSKPVRQSQLYDAIMSAIAASDPAWRSARAGAADGSLAGAGVTPTVTMGARLLLAEDNEINQAVAQEILIKAGYRCDVVENGWKAVHGALTGRYDLVLMDCQMPGMDGYEATQAIRKHEAARAEAGAVRRVPILALTANAIKGDLEKCVSAGMDDYSTKPIEPQQLIAKIEALLAGATRPDQPRQRRLSTADVGETAAVGPHPSDGADTSPVFDSAALRRRCMDNEAMYQKIIGKFERQSGDQLAQIERATDAGNLDEVAFVSHALAGAARMLAADAVARRAAELQQLARAGDGDGARARVSELRAEVERCRSQIAHERAAVDHKELAGAI
jgi:CheY-like chemotaxis protein/HPt (histidine-containing phosphotransfer) domain-containing protein